MRNDWLNEDEQSVAAELIISTEPLGPDHLAIVEEPTKHAVLKFEFELLPACTYCGAPYAARQNRAGVRLGRAVKRLLRAM